MGIKEYARRKALQFIFQPANLSSLLMPRSNYDYKSKVNGWQSSIVMACVGWIQRVYPEAPVMVQKRNKDGEWETEHDHPLTALLERPNKYYDGLLMSMAIVADLVISGNAYKLKVRSAAGRVVEHWWTPSTLIEPKFPSDGSAYLTHYEYTPGGRKQDLATEDVVHYRLGLDPNNTRKGLSPLQSLFREIFTDDEAANMTATLLRNLGVPGLLISPDSNSTVAPQDVEAVKKYVKDKTTGDHRGEPMVLTGATKLQSFGFSPEQMNLKDLRRIPEERVAACLGTIAAVVGLGSGLEQTKVGATMSELREMAYESGIIPLQRIIASQSKHQELIDFVDESQLPNYQIAYDLSKVRVLQEDENKLTDRTINQVNGGLLKVVDGQRRLNIPVDETQDFYLRPYTAMVVRSGEEPQKDLTQEPPAKALKSSDDWTEEQKTVYWKAVDSQRMSFWDVLQKRFEPEYEAIGEALAKAAEDGNRDTDSIIDSQEDSFKEAIKKAFITVSEAFSEEVAKSHGIPERKFDIFSTFAQKWIEAHAAEQVVTILGTQKELAAGIIKQAVAENWTNAYLSKHLRQYYDDNKSFFAQRVARTETTAAASFGQKNTAKEAGFGHKTWISARDARVRDTHSAMDGETVGIDDTFSNGCTEPGIGGSASEVVMCRCTMKFSR